MTLIKERAMKKKCEMNRACEMGAAFLALTIVFSAAACGAQQTAAEPEEQSEVSATEIPSTAKTQVHVAADGSDAAGDGTEDAPYATVNRAAETAPGSLIIVHGGEYRPVRLGADCSGSEASPTVIRAAEGEKAVVHAGNGTGISLVNVSHISVEGLETVGGTHGIEYRSTREAGDRPLADISIRNCRVHGVRGVHGIFVYACNDLAPVSDLAIEGCEVYDCECGSSESLVLNGNIDGFLIAGNAVHDNNNIGIDIIGFEGLAKHPDPADGKNPYEADQPRNGICRDNVVYNISAEGNPAYCEDGEYDLCADGIYVDGGRDIEICRNFIFNCDIGLEVATEHSPEENELFLVSGVRVHDNVIADCTGWTGICFGGYDKDLGFTEGCEFDHNTLADNIVQIGVQWSRGNRVYANLVIGGETGVEFNEECPEEDMVNEISGNIMAEVEDEESWDEAYGQVYADRAEVADGFCSLIGDCGSRFVPDEDMMELYEKES